jgi:hypothetical protein
MNKLIEVGKFIAVKSNQEYVNVYNIKKFKEMSNDKIVCWNSSETKELFFDYFQELPDGDRHPFMDCWKDSKGKIVTWNEIEDGNTFIKISSK